MIIEKEPVDVFGYFEKISSIPRASGNERKISDYLVEFAKEHGLKYVQDEALNVVIYKNATKNCIDKPTIILQSHIDMVCVHDDDATKIPEKEGVELFVDGDFIRAKGTTLGADDGIGVAFALAVLASDIIEHPAIEAVFTTSEEVGLDGAKALDVSLLKGRKLINIDTEEEANLVIGCAGGCVSRIVLKPEIKTVEGVLTRIVISGLVGGHSGVEIYKGSANANVLMGRVLQELKPLIDYSLVDVKGGTKDNAICDSSVANIIVSKNEYDNLVDFIKATENQIKSEYYITDTDLNIKVSRLDDVNKEVLSDDCLTKLLTILNVSPAGVIKRRQSDPKYIETSLNLGILNADINGISISHCLRSNVDAGRNRLKYSLELLANAVGAEIEFEGEYPAWESKGISEFAQRASRIYENLYGKSLHIYTEHAGLECALFYSKMNDLDAISIGPDITGAHTTKEAVSISSVLREWEFFVELLKD